MVKKFIAIAPAGKEFLFNKNSMIGCPAASASKIAAALNKIGYKLKPGLIWHVYDNDFYYNDFILTYIKSYNGRGNIYDCCGKIVFYDIPILKEAVAVPACNEYRPNKEVK